MLKLSKPTSSQAYTVVMKHAEPVHGCGEPVSGHAQVVPTVEGTLVHRLHNAVVMHDELIELHEFRD